MTRLGPVDHPSFSVVHSAGSGQHQFVPAPLSAPTGTETQPQPRGGRKRGKQEPTAHTTHRNAAGQGGGGGGRRRQWRRLKRPGRGFLLAYLSLPLIYYCAAPFNLARKSKQQEEEFLCCGPIRSAA